MFEEAIWVQRREIPMWANAAVAVLRVQAGQDARRTCVCVVCGRRGFDEVVDGGLGGCMQCGAGRGGRRKRQTVVIESQIGDMARVFRSRVCRLHRAHPHRSEMGPLPRPLGLRICARVSIAEVAQIGSLFGGQPRPRAAQAHCMLACESARTI